MRMQTTYIYVQVLDTPYEALRVRQENVRYWRNILMNAIDSNDIELLESSRWPMQSALTDLISAQEAVMTHEQQLADEAAGITKERDNDNANTSHEKQ